MLCFTYTFGQSAAETGYVPSTPLTVPTTFVNTLFVTVRLEVPLAATATPAPSAKPSPVTVTSDPPVTDRMLAAVPSVTVSTEQPLSPSRVSPLAPETATGVEK